MYDPEQLVEVTWNNANKKHYTELGYEYTKKGNTFIAKAKDLITNSSVYIDAVCDYCGKEKHVTILQYNQNTQYGKTKYSCGDVNCRTAKINNLYGAERREQQFQKFIDKCENYDYKPISMIDSYINAHSKLSFECPEHGIQTVIYNNFIYEGQICSECTLEKQKDILKLSKDEVIRRVESKNNNKILNPDEYVNIFTKNLKIICGMCNNIFLSSLSSLENGDGACRDCSLLKTAAEQRLDILTVKSIIESVNNNILLNPEDYVKNNVVNLRIQCQCGNIFITSLSSYTTSNKTRCNYCTNRISTGELLIRNVLDKYNIRYIPEYVFNDCRDIRPLPFDFYLPDYNVCIEFDGQGHFEPIEAFGGEETLKIRQYHDQIKNNYCESNKIKLIRIPYWEGDNIQQILIKELNIKEKQIA